MSAQLEPPLYPACPRKVPLCGEAYLCHVIGNPVRLALLRALIAKTHLSINELAPLASISVDAVSRHMAVLREAGIVVTVDPPDGDRRKIVHTLREGLLFRDESGAPVLDLGLFVARL